MLSSFTYDYTAYEAGALAVIDGRLPFEHGYIYPPILAQMLAIPIQVLGREMTQGLYWGLIHCVMVYAACVAAWYGTRMPSALVRDASLRKVIPVLLLFFGIFTLPFREAVRVCGNVDVLIYALFLTAFVVERGRRSTRGALVAGCFIGLGAAMKVILVPVGAVLFLHGVVAQKRRLVLLAISAGVTTILIWCLDVTGTMHYITVVLLGGGADQGVGVWGFGPSAMLELLGLGAGKSHYIITGLIVASTAATARRPTEDAWVLGALSIIVINPMTKTYSMAYLMVAVLALLTSPSTSRAHGRGVAIAVTAVFALWSSVETLNTFGVNGMIACMVLFQGAAAALLLAVHRREASSKESQTTDHPRGTSSSGRHPDGP